MVTSCAFIVGKDILREDVENELKIDYFLIYYNIVVVENCLKKESLRNGSICTKPYSSLTT